MRAVLVAAFALLLALPAASAQMNPQLVLEVQAPLDPVGPEGAVVTLALSLHCPNAAYLMPSQIVDLQIRGPPGGVVDGPESVTFDSFPCVQQEAQEATAKFTVKLPTDALGDEVFVYRIDASPRDDGNPVFRPSGPGDAEFTLTAPPAPEAPPELEALATQNMTPEEALSTAAEEAAMQDDVANIPSPSVGLALLGLGLAALRRR